MAAILQSKHGTAGYVPEDLKKGRQSTLYMAGRRQVPLMGPNVYIPVTFRASRYKCFKKTEGYIVGDVSHQPGGAPAAAVEVAPVSSVAPFDGDEDVFHKAEESNPFGAPSPKLADKLGLGHSDTQPDARHGLFWVFAC